MRKRILLAVLHVSIVLSLGVKLLHDRSTRPRYWLKAAPVDPDLPIRGRYLSLRVELPVTDAELPPVRPRPKDWPEKDPWPPRWQRNYVAVKLDPTPQGLIARAQGKAEREEYLSGEEGNATFPDRMRALPKEAWTVTLQEPLAFFIPEHAVDPSRLKPGEELWVEVTLPKKGPLRPIRLGLKKGGTLSPLSL